MTEEHNESFDCFGETVSVLVGGEAGPARVAALRARIQLLDMHRRLSRFDVQSELSLLNADSREAVPASRLLRRLAYAVIEAGHRSKGLVDATRLAQLEQAGYSGSLVGSSPFPLRDALEIAPDRRPAQADPENCWDLIRVDNTAATIRRPPGLRLDSGGIAKGLAADLIASELADHPTYAVDCAGDIRFGGTGEAPRKVLVDDPFGGPPLHEWVLSSGAVATSGIGKRSWVRDGHPAHHLIDPGSGAPAFTGIVQATALAPTAVEAEVLAKTAILSGPETASTSLPHGGVVVFDDGSIEELPA